ncbi:hypothetical protein EJB05_08228, partial [Eragrostis curvula]
VQDNQLCPSIELQEACSLPFSLLRVTSELHEQVIQEGDAQGTVQENSLGMSWMGLTSLKIKIRKK